MGDPPVPLTGIQISRILKPVRQAARDIQTLSNPPAHPVAPAPVAPPVARLAPDGSLLVQTTAEDARVVPFSRVLDPTYQSSFTMLPSATLLAARKRYVRIMGAPLPREL